MVLYILELKGSKKSIGQPSNTSKKQTYHPIRKKIYFLINNAVAVLYALGTFIGTSGSIAKLFIPF
jgi:hypothetical protein